RGAARAAGGRHRPRPAASRRTIRRPTLTARSGILPGTRWPPRPSSGPPCGGCQFRRREGERETRGVLRGKTKKPTRSTGWASRMCLAQLLGVNLATTLMLLITQAVLLVSFSFQPRLAADPLGTTLKVSWI